MKEDAKQRIRLVTLGCNPHGFYFQQKAVLDMLRGEIFDNA
jgi:hypothetical protein